MSTTCIALLRAVNVGGRTTLPMANLRALLLDLGLEQPATVLQSGNAVFLTTARATAPLEARLEREAAARLSLETTFFVRTAGEWEQLVAANPFVAEAVSDPSHLVVMFLKHAPAPAAVSALRAAIKGRERVSAVGRELYIVYPDGIGVSKLTGAVIEKTLGTRGTARNWNTVQKLSARAIAP